MSVEGNGSKISSEQVGNRIPAYQGGKTSFDTNEHGGDFETPDVNSADPRSGEIGGGEGWVSGGEGGDPESGARIPHPVTGNNFSGSK